MSVETELAWAAGFFDGEGSTSIHPNVVNMRTYFFLCMQLTQTGDILPYTLERFRKAVGEGKVYGPYTPAGLGSLPVWKWQVQKGLSVRLVGDRLRPYLSPNKITQFDYCLKVWDNRKEER